MKNYDLNKIFVEGDSDKLFIDFILVKYFEIFDPKLVVNVQGKDKLVKQMELYDTVRKVNNAKNLIIFDTDYNNQNSKGGSEERKKEYLSIAKKLKVDFRLFLLPFDNEQEGILEDLLNECFNSEFKFFDNCWQQMLDCVKKNNAAQLNIPAQKAFMYSKIDLFKNHRQNLKWNYKTSNHYDYEDSGIWDIDVNGNPKLEKLVNFIKENLFNK